jgi:hypothetical protein
MFQELLGALLMIECNIELELPTPWKGERFKLSKLGWINFFVGPNGSGKSRFCEALKGRLDKSRLLGTDRLRGMEKNAGMGFMGDLFTGGYQKNLFGHMRNAGAQFGSGLDTLVILEERLDLRIRVEATLSHLFDRRIILEWDSGNLVPKAILGESGSAYRLDTDECHGIKELLVMLKLIGDHAGSPIGGRHVGYSRTALASSRSACSTGTG